MRGFCGIIICSLLFFLVSCKYHILKNTQPDQGVFNSTTSISSDLVQKSVLGTCIQCHNNFAEINNIRAGIKEIQSRISSDQMPPADRGFKPLDACLKSILQQWVSEGLPDQSQTLVSNLVGCNQGVPISQPETPILEMPITYETLRNRILEKRCLHCHNPQSEDPDAAEILLAPYEELVAHKNLLGENSSTSQFYKIVSRTDDERMPPPVDSSPLPAEEIEFIKKWINAGHP